MIDWPTLLRHWSTELMATGLAARVDPPPASPDWLGYPPATDADVAALERRLGLRLPPSYAAFLRTSNGWRRTTFAIARLRPAAEVAPFAVENEEWAAAYEEDFGDVVDAEYFAYPDGMGPGHRGAHLRHLVQVSDVDDGVYLLNPRAVTPDGEWEAWFFANWVPGAVRYPSLAHLMVAEFRSFRQVQNVPAGGWVPPALAVPPAAKRAVAKRVVKAKAAKAAAATVDELVLQLASADRAVRGRAVRTLAGRLGGRGHWAVPRPDLVGPLSDLFGRSDDPAVRAVCVSALTEVAPDDQPPPPPLLAALSDPDPGVVLSAIEALTYMPDPRAVGPLCRFIESGVNDLFNENAMSALAELGHPAAVPTLVGVMTNTANPFDQSFASAGIALGRIASPGAIDALIAGLAHADSRVRFAAVVGLDVSGDPRAADLLAGMGDDPDETVRRRAGHHAGRPSW